MAKLLNERKCGFKIIYTYACDDCGYGVEYTRRMDNAHVKCPLCQKERMKKAQKRYKEERETAIRNSVIEEVLDGIISCKDVSEVYEMVKGLRVVS